MLNDNHLKLIKKEVFKYCKEKNYRPLRITILGSHFIKTNNEHSDVDVYVMVALPLKYYLGDVSLNYLYMMDDFQKDIVIEGVPITADIHYIDIISKVKEFHYEHHNYLVDALLSGRTVYENDSLRTLLMRIYDYHKHLNKLDDLLNNYISDLNNDSANGKVACRIIRDIARTKQLLKDKTYDYNITLDEMIEGDAIFEGILSRQRVGEIVFLTNEESFYFKQTIKYLIKQIEKENEYYDEDESVKYDDELTQYLMNVVMEHNKDALRISE